MPLRNATAGVEGVLPYSVVTILWLLLVTFSARLVLVAWRRSKETKRQVRDCFSKNLKQT